MAKQPCIIIGKQRNVNGISCPPFFYLKDFSQLFLILYTDDVGAAVVGNKLASIGLARCVNSRGQSATLSAHWYLHKFIRQK